MIVGLIREVLTDESGATAIEYGLIASLVSVASIAAFDSMGSSVRDMFNQVADRLEEANNISGG